MIDKLYRCRSLSLQEYEYLITHMPNPDYINELARKRAREVYGNKIYIRGLIEVSNICKNDCLYCGIRHSNKKAERYRLTEDEILSCCDEGYELGYRTFVLQGGDDAYFSDKLLCRLIEEIKCRYPDTAVTLSLGERSNESYRALKEAGADRYLLRHETADCRHYGKLHPDEMSFENRIRCLYDLRESGYQVGCGFMVGSPYQTPTVLAKDLKFIEEFKPDMCGVGPFIPHKDTPFNDRPSGSAELTCYLLSVIRLIHPDILLPATTALGTVSDNGRIRGILSGANVLMPNLSPVSVRSKYSLYNNKLYTGVESARALRQLKSIVADIGYEIDINKGDKKGV